MKELENQKAVNQESKNQESVKAEALPDSMAVIDAFLAGAGGEVVTEGAEPADWRDAPLPEGHKSGFVAVIGRPSVGKSTLVNALVGQKVSIVSAKSQTTRTRVSAILNAPEYQLIFIDTPGIHKKTPHKLNRLMVEQAVSAIPDADVILFVVDVSRLPYEEDEMIATLLREKAEKRPVFFVLNKMDRLPMHRAKQNVESYWALLPTYTDSIPVSALNGTNLPLLHDHILAQIPEGPRYYPGDQLTDQTEHQIAGELIREALLHHTYQEVPHSLAVLVEDYEERENGVLYLAATLWVERESQKPILIGKGGERLKTIGSAARRELERFIGGKVFLDLWVKVKPKWRDEDARLRELGFK
ncbi:MAG TPA: GTPase Era [Anaerolineae bacterium]|nr:GTPase Era [Anaerolineae bacterium]